MELVVCQGEDGWGKLWGGRTPSRPFPPVQRGSRTLLSSLLSSTCSGGTCDGCNFHFLWESAAACPLCSAADYHAITSSCVAGVQVGSSSRSHPRREGCVVCEFPGFLPNRRLPTCGESQSCA